MDRQRATGKQQDRWQQRQQCPTRNVHHRGCLQVSSGSHQQSHLSSASTVASSLARASSGSPSSPRCACKQRRRAGMCVQRGDLVPATTQRTVAGSSQGRQSVSAVDRQGRPRHQVKRRTWRSAPSNASSAVKKPRTRLRPDSSPARCEAYSPSERTLSRSLRGWVASSMHRFSTTMQWRYASGSLEPLQQRWLVAHPNALQWAVGSAAWGWCSPSEHARAQQLPCGRRVLHCSSTRGRGVWGSEHQLRCLDAARPRPKLGPTPRQVT